MYTKKHLPRSHRGAARRPLQPVDPLVVGVAVDVALHSVVGLATTAAAAAAAAAFLAPALLPARTTTSARPLHHHVSTARDTRQRRVGSGQGTPPPAKRAGRAGLGSCAASTSTAAGTLGRAGAQASAPPEPWSPGALATLVPPGRTPWSQAPCTLTTDRACCTATHPRPPCESSCPWPRGSYEPRCRGAGAAMPSCEPRCRGAGAAMPSRSRPPSSP